jgi:hypothetical protein
MQNMETYHCTESEKNVRRGTRPFLLDVGRINRLSDDKVLGMFCDPEGLVDIRKFQSLFRYTYEHISQ